MPFPLLETVVATRVDNNICCRIIHQIIKGIVAYDMTIGINLCQHNASLWTQLFHHQTLQQLICNFWEIMAIVRLIKYDITTIFPVSCTSWGYFRCFCLIDLALSNQRIYLDKIYLTQVCNTSGYCTRFTLAIIHSQPIWPWPTANRLNNVSQDVTTRHSADVNNWVYYSTGNNWNGCFVTVWMQSLQLQLLKISRICIIKHVLQNITPLYGTYPTWSVIIWQIYLHG